VNAFVILDGRLAMELCLEAQEKRNNWTVSAATGKNKIKISVRGLICYDEMGLDGIRAGQRRTKARPRFSQHCRFTSSPLSDCFLSPVFKREIERIKSCDRRHTKRV